MKHDHALQKYDDEFYAEQINGSLQSARIVAPQILSIFPDTHSAIDIGCGAGTWLSEFKRLGVEKVLGFDGGNPAKGTLLISQEEYRKVDFTEGFPADLKSDLVMSLEVAEHLDRRHALQFVESLCGISDLILFGAAIPGQGGTHHVNERWPSYWEDMFNSKGYQFYDVVRNTHWHDRRVEWWYRQNIFLIVRTNRADLVERIEKSISQLDLSLPRDCVHPEMYLAAKQKVQTLKHQLQNEKDEVQGLKHQLQNEKDKVHELENQLTSFFDSNSWRLMSAPRAVLKFIKKASPF